MMNGCVNYTGRFFNEVLQNPAQASPLIFPETVFNAPASHIASFLGIDGVVSTLVGSSNAIVEALDTAAFWIRSGIVEECLIIAAEECDWLSAEALTYYHPKLIASEGAGALLLRWPPLPHLRRANPASGGVDQPQQLPHRLPARVLVALRAVGRCPPESGDEQARAK